MTLPKLIQVSRPRFWLYLLGPFLIGSISALSSIPYSFSWQFTFWFIYWTLPANLLLYGVNDIFDYETDRLNPKKTKYEALVTKAEHRFLAVSILLTQLPFLILFGSLPLFAMISTVGFWFLSFGYSMPPIRLKTKPFLDSISNILYVFPGLMGYYLINPYPSIDWTVVILAGLWTMAMHSYSAIPDIEVDRATNTPTIATVLGFNGTLIYCTSLYLISAIFSISFLGGFSIVFGIIYFLLMIFTWIYRANSMSIYRLFPIINTIVGMVIFWIITWQRL